MSTRTIVPQSKEEWMRQERFNLIGRLAVAIMSNPSTNIVGVKNDPKIVAQVATAVADAIIEEC